jgi:hypothetical protein
VKWDSVKWVVGEIIVGEMYPNSFRYGIHMEHSAIPVWIHTGRLCTLSILEGAKLGEKKVDYIPFFIEVSVWITVWIPF